MAEDWIKESAAIYKRNQHEQQNIQKRTTVAEAEAPDVFRKILDRIRQDIQALKDAGVSSFSNLEKQFSEEKFSTTVAASPLAATLEIELSTVLIKYEYILIQKDFQVERRIGSLRIDSDLNGAVRIYKNGDIFSSESEVSKFLLRPLLNHVNSQ